MASHDESEESYLDKIAPKGLNQFDAFPKLPNTYKERSGSRGALSIVIALLAFLFVLNDVGEWIWGWPTYGFSVERNAASYMDVNIDVLVNMPCGCESLIVSWAHSYSKILTRVQTSVLTFGTFLVIASISVKVYDATA